MVWVNRGLEWLHDTECLNESVGECVEGTEWVSFVSDRVVISRSGMGANV